MSVRPEDFGSGAFAAWAETAIGENQALRSVLSDMEAEVERLQAQVAQLTAERDRVIAAKHPFAMDHLRAVEERDHLRARCAQLEGAAKKAVSSYGDPYHERAIELLSAALDQHATSNDA